MTIIHEFDSLWPTQHCKDSRFWLVENKLADFEVEAQRKNFLHWISAISNGENLQKGTTNNIHHKICQISWKQSKSDVPVPLATMYLFYPHFQNSDCVLTMSSWGISVMKCQYLLLRKSLMFQVSVILLSDCLDLTAFLGTTDSEVHIVHISCVIIAYMLESLSSLT